MRKLAAALVALLPLNALAAAPKAGPVSGVTVDVPRTELSFSEEQAHAPTAQIELSLSSWAPSEFAPATVSAKLPAYSASLPYLSIARLIPLASGRAGDLGLKMGGGFLALSRTSGSASQNAYLIHERVGAEYRKPLASLGGAAPFLGVSLLPTMSITPRSVFGDGSTEWGMGAELSAGVASRASFIGLKDSDIFAGLHATTGKVANSSVGGIGFEAGIKIGI